MAPHTLLIDRGEAVSGGVPVAWPWIRSVIAHRWDLSTADLAWLCHCPIEAVVISRVGPVHIAHGGAWARVRELESLSWSLVEPVSISGKALAIRPDHENGGWRALTSWEAGNAERVLRGHGGEITQPTSRCWERLEQQLSGERLARYVSATWRERLEILRTFAVERAEAKRQAELIGA